MNYEEFIAAVEDAVRDSLPSNRVVQIHQVTKNNGKVRTGITILEREATLSPTIYLEEYYESYLATESLEDIVERILNIYEEVKFEYNWDTACLTDYERVKEHIVYKLIHTERNREMLETIPSESFLDLSLVCYVLLELDRCGNATVPVTNHLLSVWKVDKQEVFARARENVERILPEQFYNMQCVVNRLFENGPSTIAGSGIYVLSNEKGNMGAVTILYENVLEKIGDYLEENYFVIPSSIHEVLIFPESAGIDRERIDEIIGEVNELHVAPEEVLADHAYYYDRETKGLSM